MRQVSLVAIEKTKQEQIAKLIEILLDNEYAIALYNEEDLVIIQYEYDNPKYPSRPIWLNDDEYVANYGDCKDSRD